jgi:SpoVK/Ycf46/Vps4 family AAA+-type ATPase
MLSSPNTPPTPSIPPTPSTSPTPSIPSTPSISSFHYNNFVDGSNNNNNNNNNHHANNNTKSSKFSFIEYLDSYNDKSIDVNELNTLIAHINYEFISNHYGHHHFSGKTKEPYYARSIPHYIHSSNNYNDWYHKNNWGNKDNYKQYKEDHVTSQKNNDSIYPVNGGNRDAYSAKSPLYEYIMPPPHHPPPFSFIMHSHSHDSSMCTNKCKPISNSHFVNKSLEQPLNTCDAIKSNEYSNTMPYYYYDPYFDPYYYPSYYDSPYYPNPYHHFSLYSNPPYSHFDNKIDTHKWLNTSKDEIPVSQTMPTFFQQSNNKRKYTHTMHQDKKTKYASKYAHKYASKYAYNKLPLFNGIKTISFEPSNQYFTYMTPYTNLHFSSQYSSNIVDASNNMAAMGTGAASHVPSGLPEKNRVTINEKIECIQDILNIIQKYPVAPNTEYNIDIKSLNKIKTELEELNNMVGMKQLKTSIVSQLLYFIQELHIHPNGNTEMGDYKHTVLYGQPGTGKTEIAKIIGNMYSKIGILKKSIFKVVTRNDLVAGYLGQTAIKTKGVINECLGGVLFIDEAYALTNSNELDSFSKECIDTLCESLSFHKHDLMVIVAGYEEDMNKYFFQANKGLDSRFIWRFKIDKYTADELMQIFMKKIKEASWKISDDCTIDSKWFKSNMGKFKHYGRDMEQLFFYTKISHSKRVYGLDVECKRTIQNEDVENGMKMFLNNQKKDEDNDAMRKIMQTLYI